jgi:hypothetical protein
MCLTDFAFFLCQRVYWYVWNDTHEYLPLIFPPMMFAVFDLLLVLFLLLLVYRHHLDVYSMSGIGPLASFFVYLLLIGSLLWYEFHVFLEHAGQSSNDVPSGSGNTENDAGVSDLNQRFEGWQHGALFLLTAALVIGLTIYTSMDASLR